MDKQNFGRDLERSREELGMNGYDLARELNISPTAIHKWENGTSFPVPAKWKAIKGLTNINPQDYINYDSKSRNELYNDIAKFTIEHPKGRIPRVPAKLMKKLRALDLPPNIKPAARRSNYPIQIPFIPWIDLESWDPAIHPFPSRELDSVGSDISISPNITKSRYVFAVVVQNDSMEPEFFKGDMIVVDPEKKAADGSYIIARIGTETTLKQYVTDGASVFLKPVNDRYPIRDMTGVDFRIIGVVIEKRKRYFWDIEQEVST